MVNTFGQILEVVPLPVVQEVNYSC